MKSILILTFTCLFTTGFTQNNSTDITIGKTDSIYSNLLKEKRSIWVYLPNTNGPAIFAAQKYPVVYLLDGDGHFQSVVGLIQQLSQVNGNTNLPEMIVVGIPNTDRTRDLTPTHVNGGPNMDSNFTRTSGGGENFTSFLEKELIPYIDSKYPTAPYRVYIGHSFGGLMVMNTLLHHSQLFNAYLAIDPSMWWDNQELLNASPSLLKQDKLNGRRLYLAVANTMPEKMDTAAVRKDTTNTTLHIRSILQLAATLKQNAPAGLIWNYRFYDHDDHGSVPLISEYDGLRFIFDYYKMPSLGNPFDTSVQVDKVIADHFNQVSKELGYKVSPPEPLVNGLGYGFLQMKNWNRAFTFFKMNISNYPGSFNVYDSMGDYYVARGEKEKAIEQFKKALELKNNPDTKKKMDDLMKKQ